MNRFIRIAVSLVLVVGIFFFALPKFADFSQVWDEIAEMTWIELATIALAALWNIFTYWFVMMSAMPGSNIWQTMKINQASTAVANTFPGGGAIGVGVTYGMYTSYGFTPEQISLSVLVSGIWNNLVKLGMPVIALGLLVLKGDAGGSLLVASLAGLGVLTGALVMFGAVLKSERLARKVGRRLAAAVVRLRSWLRKEPSSELEESTVRMRRDAIDLIRTRWLSLTLSTLISHLSLYLVLLLALRHVGVSEADVSWIEVLAAFAFVRLVSALPITPGGLGVVELGLTAALVAAGGREAAVVAAVLVYRALTYLLPIPFGLAAYLKWRGGSAARRARLEAMTAPGSIAEGGTPP